MINTESNDKKAAWNVCKKRGKKKHYKKKLYWKENKIHFIPIKVKIFLDNLFKENPNPILFLEKVSDEIKRTPKIENSVYVYIIHKAATLDRTELIEKILNKTNQRKQLANSKCGKMEYTPIFKSAYRGSYNALRIFLCAGADKTVINKVGETPIQALEQGRNDSINRDPDYVTFINERYDKCRIFLENFKLREKNIVLKKKINLDTLTIEQLIKNHLDDTKLVKHFLNNPEHKKDNFIKMTLASLSNFDKFNQFFDVIKELIKDDFINLDFIKEILKDEELHDYLQFDAPFAKEKINSLIN